MLADRLILRGADAYDEARFAHIFNARRPDRVKTLTDDAWARLQQIRAERDPSGLFVDYLASPGGFRNLNGWEKNDD
jgi:FAD/FMN-containing dehydrogenase